MSEHTPEQEAERERRRLGLAPKASVIVSPHIPAEPVAPPDDVTSAEIVGMKPTKAKPHARKK